MSELAAGRYESRDHYAYVTRSLIRLYNSGRLTNVDDIKVEPNYGYLARISYVDGSYRITYGNDLGINPGAASELAKDKGHSKFLLRAIGVNCPEGREFLLPWWADEIGPSQQKRGNDAISTTDDAGPYIDETLGYPVYMNPVDGSKGANIFLIAGAEELGEAVRLYDEKKVRVAIIEEPVSMPDYRVVTLDGELISAYRRIPLGVVGDGQSTIRQLVENLQQSYEEAQRDTRISADDPRITQYLSKHGYALTDTPAEGEQLVLVPVSNLSMGGTSEDVTGTIDQRWVKLAAFVSRNFNLRLSGLDLACADITDAEADYSVLEINSAPGLDHYALSGEAQKEIVDGLYTKVFNALSSAETGLV